MKFVSGWCIVILITQHVCIALLLNRILAHWTLLNDMVFYWMGYCPFNIWIVTFDMILAFLWDIVPLIILLALYIGWRCILGWIVYWVALCIGELTLPSAQYIAPWLATCIAYCCRGRPDGCPQNIVLINEHVYHRNQIWKILINTSK